MEFSEDVLLFLRTGRKATGGTNTTLVDANVSWQVNEFAGLPVKILHTGGIEYHTIVTSNTATQLTFPALPGAVAVAAGDAFFFPFDLASALLLGYTVIATGAFTNNSATVPADNTRAATHAWENNDYFKGNLLMPVEGVDRFQARRIVQFTVAGGIFTLDPNNPFSQAPGVAPIRYVVLSEQTEFVPAVNALINRTPADVGGNKEDDATADDMSALLTASQVAELKRILLRMSGAGVFSADIQGVARTELDTMLAQLAIYFMAAGGVMNPTINGANPTSVSTITQNLANYLKAGGAAFNPTVNNAAKADVTDALASLNDILISATGILAWIARALPANGVSLSEAVRYTAEVKPEFGTPVSTSYTTVAAAETVFLTYIPTVPGIIYFDLSLQNMIAGDDMIFRAYKRVDATAYEMFYEKEILASYPFKKIGFSAYFDISERIQVSVERVSATNRNFPYNYNTKRQPVV